MDTAAALEKAVEHHRAGRPADAYPSARNNLGTALRAQERLPEALACYDDAIALDPNFYQARSNRAITLLAMQRLDDAERACRDAIALDPRRPEGYITLGMTLE